MLERNVLELINWIKTKKNNLTMKKLENDKDQKLEDPNDKTFTFGEDGDKRTQSRMDMRLSRSSIFKSVRLWQKLKFRPKGEERLRIDATGEFLTHLMAFQGQ